MNTKQNNITLNEKEIKNIVSKATKKIIAEIKRRHKCFSRTSKSKELEDYTYLSPSDTGLPAGIYVDAGQAYQTYNHPLCIYIADPIYLSRIYPIVVSFQPYCPIHPNFDINPFYNFIKKNISALYDYADMSISSPMFYKLIDESRAESMSLINEMGNYYPEETGLPVTVWIDETQAYKRSPHPNSYRMKFQQDKDLFNYHSWMPILIPDLTIHRTDKIPKCKISQRDINKVFQWAQQNMAGLLLLKDAIITGKEFSENYHKPLDGVNVQTDHVDDVPSYAKTGKEMFGFTIVKTDNNKYNFVDQNDLLLFPEQWFDEVRHFCLNTKDNKPYAYGKIEDDWYSITTDRKLCKILSQ